AGVVAGLALAAPLGAIGVLLVQEGILRGLLGGLPSAAAVATVDTLYCAGAVAAGAVLSPVITTWAPWPQIGGGAVLIALGVHGLVKGWRTARRTAATHAAHAMDSVAPSTRVHSSTPSPSTTGWARYALFLGLTAINPATLLYFAAILPGLKETTSSNTAQVGFVVGVALASFAWQALLVALGAGMRHKTGASFRNWTAVIGNSTVAVLGAILIAQVV
ncbi:MAG TPA: LysE family transporter, partial [Microbacterium sp.]|uniref:LysE family transporter n=1 Tax=Microbacterium sp. TaxID=51671 RepID=UPI002F92806B